MEDGGCDSTMRVNWGGDKKGRQIMCRPEIVERKKFSFLSLCL